MIIFISQMIVRLPVMMLPRVLWQHIALWLQGDNAIIHLRATCRWLRRVEIHQLPRHMELRITEERLRSIASIRRLNLCNNRCINNEILQDVFRVGTSRLVGTLEWLDVSFTTITWFPSTLRHLDIYRCRNVTNEMLQKCTRLEWLNASYTNVTWFPSTLHHLSILGCKNVTNEILQDAFQVGTSRQVGTLEWLDARDTKVTWFPSTLRLLDIYGCKDVTNEMIQGCTKLEWLDATYTNVTWFPSTLQCLIIFKRTDVTNAMIQGCTKLEWLNAGYTNVTWFPSTLRKLIICCTDVTDEMLAHLKDCEMIR